MGSFSDILSQKTPNFWDKHNIPNSIFHNISPSIVKKILYLCFLHETGQNTVCVQVDAIYWLYGALFSRKRGRSLV